LDWSVGIGDGTTVEDSNDECTTDETAYHKYGLLMEGIGAVSGSCVTFFYDGEPIYTTADYNDMPLLLMCPVFQAHGDGTDQPYIYMDWLRVAVYNANGGGRES